jgi:hypothetical protein
MKSESETLQELLTEAHGVMKDLGRMIKDYRALVAKADAIRATFELVMENFEDKVKEVAVTEVKTLLETTANEGVDRFAAQMIDMIRESEAAINGRFDRLTKTLMFEEDGGERIQGLTLPEYIQAVADYKNGIQVKPREGGRTGVFESD